MLISNQISTAVETDEIGDLVGKKRLLDGSVSECKKGYC